MIRTNVAISDLEALQIVRDFNAVIKRMIEASMVDEFQTGFELSGDNRGLTSAKYHLAFKRLPVEASKELFDWSKNDY